MTTVGFNRVPTSVLGTVLTFIPGQFYQFATVSKGCLAVSQDCSFIFPYFQELSKELGQERLMQLLDQRDWSISKTLLDKLTQAVYQYARTTSLGEESLKTKPSHGIFSAAQLANIVKLRDLEEDKNLVSMAPRLLQGVVNLTTLYANIDTGNSEKRVIFGLKAQAVRNVIASMNNAERSQIVELNLGRLLSTSIPKEIFLFTNLKRLNLEINQLKKLPPQIGKLTNLRYLNLEYNQLTGIPPQIGNLIKLRHLKLGNNQIRALPLEFIKLTKLKDFQLSHYQSESASSQCNNLNNSELILHIKYLHAKRLLKIAKKLLNFLYRYRKKIFSLLFSLLILLSTLSGILEILKEMSKIILRISKSSIAI